MGAQPHYRAHSSMLGQCTVGQARFPAAATAILQMPAHSDASFIRLTIANAIKMEGC